MPLLVGGGCGGGRLKGLFVTGVCLFILYCYFYYFEFKPDDLTVVFPTRRSKSPVLPSLLGGGGGAGSAAGTPKATRTWEFHLAWAWTVGSGLPSLPGPWGFWEPIQPLHQPPRPHLLDTLGPPGLWTLSSRQSPALPWGLSVKPHSPLPRPPPPPGRGRINVCTDFRASGIWCVLAARCGFHVQWGSLSPLVGGRGVRTLLSLVDPGPHASRPFPVLVITASSQESGPCH